MFDQGATSLRPGEMNMKFLTLLRGEGGVEGKDHIVFIGCLILNILGLAAFIYMSLFCPIKRSKQYYSELY